MGKIARQAKRMCEYEARCTCLIFRKTGLTNNTYKFPTLRVPCHFAIINTISIGTMKQCFTAGTFVLQQYNDLTLLKKKNEMLCFLLNK